MKRLPLLLSIIFLSSAITSFAQIKAGTIVVKRHQVEDSIVFDEPTPIPAKIVNYMDSIAGNWEIVTMKRQARMEAEYLVNATLVLNKDSTFTGSAGCSDIAGKFMLKGSSIKFTTINLTNTKQPCSFTEQENWFLKLLQNNISGFTANIGEGTIWLRDGASQIIFEGTKK